MRQERDLGVIISEDLKKSEQVERMVGKANMILGMLKRTDPRLESRDPGLRKDLYVYLVRPHLDYYVQGWKSYLKEDFDKIKRVQRRDSRIPFIFEQLDFEERLKYSI